MKELDWIDILLHVGVALWTTLVALTVSYEAALVVASLNTLGWPLREYLQLHDKYAHKAPEKVHWRPWRWGKQKSLEAWMPVGAAWGALGIAWMF